MKLNQLRYEVQKRGIPTSGDETRDELVRLLQAHIDAEEASRARVNRRPVMDD